MKDKLTFSNYGRLLDRIEVLECREEQYQKLIRKGIHLNQIHSLLLGEVTRRFADVGLGGAD